MLEARDGPQVMEVNSSPGLEGIEAASKLDVAGAIIEYIEAHVRFPELDVRQRLTVSRGYGVAEIHVPEGADFVGKTIASCGLREKDINVLSLARDAMVVPNPRASREICAGDRLLCFGRLDSMRGMVPEKARTARRPKPRRLREAAEASAPPPP